MGSRMMVRAQDAFFFQSMVVKRSLHYAVAVSCIHSHKPNERPASVGGHSLPSTACSWQSAFYSLSGDEKLPSSAFHGIY
jgi:hypothetical protein